jgi:uroporphyrinogen-III synthase
MRVLVTRPLEDAIDTAAELAVRGHEAVVAPLLEIRFRERATIPSDGAQAILATSSNGVRAISRVCGRRDLPVFAVGARTAAIAANLGYADVRSANGDARALEEAVSLWAEPKRGALLHPTASARPGKLAIDLTGKGFEVRTIALYRAIHVNRLPAQAHDAMRGRLLDALLLFSPRTAQTFAACVGAAHLAEECAYLDACCISEAAAEPLGALRFRDIRWASRPDQASLLALLD